MTPDTAATLAASEARTARDRDALADVSALEWEAEARG